MIRFPTLLLILILVMNVVPTRAQSILLKGKIRKGQVRAVDTLKLNPEEKVFIKENFFKNWMYKIPLKEDGSFEVNLELKEGANMFYSNVRGLPRLYLAPKGTLILEIDVSTNEPNYKISGSLAVENNYLFETTYKLSFPYNFQSSPEDFRHLQDSARDVYMDYLDKANVSSEFYEREWLRIKANHAEALLNYAGIFYHREEENSLPPDFYDFLSEMKIERQSHFLYSSTYLWFLNYYVYHTALFSKNLDATILEKVPDEEFIRNLSPNIWKFPQKSLPSNSIIPSLYERFVVAKSILDDRSLMYYLSHFFVYRVPMSSYRDSATVNLIYRDFISRYPNSKYLDVINTRYQKKKEIWSLKVSDPTFDFVVEDSLGNKQNFQGFLIKNKGKVIYLDIWSTGCKPCIEAIPQSNSLQEQYADSSFIAVNISIDGSAPESKEKWRKVIQKRQWKGLHFLCPPGGPFAPIMKAFDAVSMPTHVLITPDGRVLAGTYKPGENLIHGEIQSIFQ